MLRGSIMRGLTLSLLVTMVFLTACSGGGGGGSSAGDGGGDGPGDGGQGSVVSFANANLEIIPAGNNFNITLSNYPSLGQNVTSVLVTVTAGDNREAQYIDLSDLRTNTGRFVLANLTSSQRYNFTFEVVYSDGSLEVFSIVFEGENNGEDHDIRSDILLGPNYDGDRWADDIDTDDDGDGIKDDEDRCAKGETGWRSNDRTDADGDGCRDMGEDMDDDNDGVDDSDEVAGCQFNPDCDGDGIKDDVDECVNGETGWRSDNRTDFDGDGCRDAGEDEDDDNDGLDDVDEEVDCVLSLDCDNDSVLDGDEEAGCVLDSDCDNDSIKDGADGCVNGETGWQSNDRTDVDGDGCRDKGEANGGYGEDEDDDNDGEMDDEDIDDDGDGLIEISTPAELDAVRYQMNGRGLRMRADALLDRKGCGGSMNIINCNGYELVNNISLTEYIAETYPGTGWLPIGRRHGCLSSSAIFSAIFEGNHFVISGLSINRPSSSCMGLFGYTGSSGQVHRLGIEADRIHGSWSVGGLVGRNKGIINASYAIVGSLAGKRNIGGLVGDGQTVHMENSYAIVGSLAGERSIGGLVGSGEDVHMENSYAIVGSLAGDLNIGGLVGFSGGFDSFHQLTIRSSYAIVRSLNGDRNVGGIAGRMNTGSISSSYAIFNASHGGRYIGGLVGEANQARIVSSYAMFNRLTGYSSADDNGGGGLIGQAWSSRVISSYVIANALEGDGFLGGFIGNSTTFSMDTSYGVFGSLIRNSSINIDTLIGNYSSSTISNSYWNYETTNLATGTLGEPKSGSDLTNPTDYGGIYELWDDGVDNATIYCDSDHSGSIEEAERSNNNRIWDFGTTDEYPAINCTPDNLADQRDWWYLDDTHKVKLNQTRLDARLESSLP